MFILADKTLRDFNRFINVRLKKPDFQYNILPNCCLIAFKKSILLFLSITRNNVSETIE